MKNQLFYYLRKDQKLLITNQKENAKAVITYNDGEKVEGIFSEGKSHFFFNHFSCMVHELDKIFSKIPTNV
jgi:hypothetical protein